MIKIDLKRGFATGFLSLMVFIGGLSAVSAADMLWTDVASKANLTTFKKLNVSANKYRLLQASMTQLERQLYDTSTDQTELMLPLPDGSSALFRLQYAPVYQTELGKKYPSIRTFKGYQVNHPGNAGRFDITAHGFHASFRFNGQRVYIDPLQRGNNSTYISYFKKDGRPLSQRTSDKVVDYGGQWSQQNKQAANTSSRSAETLSSYVIAVAATGEYTAFHGGTKALGLAAIVTMINRVNEVYEVDLAVTLMLAANNDAVVFTDASTDPFVNSNNDINLNSQVMSDLIGNDNFEIGHVVNTNGGLAALGVVCVDAHKAKGVTACRIRPMTRFGLIMLRMKLAISLVVPIRLMVKRMLVMVMGVI